MTAESLQQRPRTASRPSNRACDRCRRRKHRCELVGSICANCRDAGEECTFNLPLGRRGPKRRQSRASAIHSLVGAGAVSPPNASSPQGLALINNSTWEDAVASPHSSISYPSAAPAAPAPAAVAASSHLISSLQRWTEIAACLHIVSPGLSLSLIARKCFDLFFEYLYPLTPIVHEPSLRAGLDFFISQTDEGNDLLPTARAPSWAPSFAQAVSVHEESADSPGMLKSTEFWPELTFTLITALCAEAAFLLPKDVFPEGELVAGTFLEASRNALNSHLEADLEFPTASSVAIRYFHSNCLHAAGKPKFSWHIFGEATRLAQVMQLHNESSLEGVTAVEAELRRRVFWIVYIGDKSAAILNNRPITIHQYSFNSGITTAFPSELDDATNNSAGGGGGGGSPGRPLSQPDPNHTPNYIAGFNQNLRLWQTASDLLLHMRLLQDQRASVLSPEDRAAIDRLYIRFITSLDTLPSYLDLDNFPIQEEPPILARQSLIQIANLQVSFHCLRMVITQKFEELEYFFPGVEQTEMLLLRKTEIARDMLRVLRQAPFWALQVNGEPCVEKIRMIGASLLAIIHRNETSPLSSRARSDFSVLLDILARLDSRASDTLRSGTL